MPKRYPEEFRRKVLDLVAAGRPVAQIANDLQISDQTIYDWRRQELIDTGSSPCRRPADCSRSPSRLLRMALTSALSTRGPPRLAHRPDPGRAHRLEWHLRCPQSPR